MENILNESYDIETEYIKESEYLNTLSNINAKEFRYADRISKLLLTEDNRPKTVNDRFAYFCGAVGISFNEMSNTIEAYANKISYILKTEGLNSSSKRKINKIADEFWATMNSNLNNMNYYAEEDRRFAGLDKAKVNKSLCLLFYLLAFQTLISFVLLILGPIGSVLHICIVAPITEENCKMIAIRGGFVKEFTIIFNAFEFTEYIASGAPIIGRVAAVGLHLTTTIIQYLTRNPQITDQIQMEEQDRNLKAQMTGHIIAELIHAFWNVGAILMALAGI